MKPRSRVLRAGKALYAAAAILAIGWALREANTPAAQWLDWAASPGTYAYLLGWVAMAAVLGQAWARVLADYLGLRLAVREWLPIQAAAWAGRYLPGKLGLLAGKLVLLDRAGWRGLGFSVLFEQTAFVVAGIAIALLTPLPFDRLHLPETLQRLAEAWPLRAAAVVAVVAAFFASFAFLVRRSGELRRPGPFRVVGLFIWYVAAHGIAGAGLHLWLVSAMGAQAPGLAYSIGLLAAANVAGILAVFAPAGIGVREFTIAAGLSPFMPFAQGMAVAALLRILATIADLAFFLIGGGWFRFGKRGSRA